MILTENDIRLCTKGGLGLTQKQCEILGITKTSGWIKKLTGTEISEETYEAFRKAGNTKTCTDYWRMYTDYVFKWYKENRSSIHAGALILNYNDWLKQVIEYDR